MELFSDRMGLKSQAPIQLGQVSRDLRVCIWNTIYEFYVGETLNMQRPGNPERLLGQMWTYVLKADVSDLKKLLGTTRGTHIILERLRDYIYNANWHAVLDLVQLIVIQEGDYYDSRRYGFTETINEHFRRESSGYRILDELIVPITSEIELAELQEAKAGGHRDQAGIHIDSALRFLSNKDSPDYRNSIKESISAVESVCRLITGESTLGKALKQAEIKQHLNKQFIEGLDKIYGWTNGSDGIRHALMDEPRVGFNEAKYMVVACSALVNYLRPLIGK